MPGKRGKGERLDEFAGRLGHDHMDLKGLPLQGAHQFRRLVRGNSAGDAHGDSHGSIVAGSLDSADQSSACTAESAALAEQGPRISRELQQARLRL